MNVKVVGNSGLGRRICKGRSPGGSNECGMYEDLKGSQSYCKAVSEGGAEQ